MRLDLINQIRSHLYGIKQQKWGSSMTIKAKARLINHLINNVDFDTITQQIQSECEYQCQTVTEFDYESKDSLRDVAHKAEQIAFNYINAYLYFGNTTNKSAVSNLVNHLIVSNTDINDDKGFFDEVTAEPFKALEEALNDYNDQIHKVFNKHLHELNNQDLNILENNGLVFLEVA